MPELLSTLLDIDPTSSAGCCGPIWRRCPNKLSHLSRVRAAQIMRTGEALLAVEAPLRQCLEQLAPLMLCGEHRGEVGEKELLKLWWFLINEGTDADVYYREMEALFRHWGCLDELGGELEEEDDGGDDEDEHDDEDEDDDHVDEDYHGDGEVSTFSDTSSDTENDTDKTVSDISSLLSRLILTPQQPACLTSTPTTTNKQQKQKPPQFPKVGTPLSIARTIIAKHHGLGPNHVLPKPPVEGECGICLLGFNARGGSRAKFAEMFHPVIPVQDADDDACREKKRKRKAGEGITRGEENKEMEKIVQSKSRTLDEEELWPGYDFSRWIWCKGSCGTSYHKECMGCIGFIDLLYFTEED
ncbi:uncharacterized protein KD926_005640 [Aspergillus affinis]|uniref:uncharacterized protein n=1 Tax=Aspergillus affinis TaxID=1070780 RepID=UPI0022FF221D|nr:uncharacterized protein KD926_005640 [Aspergillus affinis]KAI9042345.1 hypothetical protein KD926_005640 [Aspergillus affinis]